MKNRNYRPRFGLGKEGAYPPRQQSPSEQHRDVYREFPPSYEGGYDPRSGPKGPAPQTTHQVQFGPVDIKAFLKPYEIVRLNTPNVRNGQLLVAIEDLFTITAGDNKFDFTSAQVTVYGYNSGVKQLVKRQWVRASTGPFRWVWTNDDQYDSLSVELEGYLFGTEINLGPEIGILIPSNPDDSIIKKLCATGVWRYVTTHPVVPEYDRIAGKGGQ